MKKEVRALYDKAVDSLVLGVDHFNRAWDRGRTEAVLILLDRAFELLLKSIIVHRGGRIREKKQESLTLGFDSCLRKCISEASIKCLSDDEALSIQTLNSLRNAAQHYLVEVSDEQLYVYAQSAVSLFAKLVKDVFKRSIKADIPERVLPVAVKPPRELGAIFDGDFAAIKKMITPGSRQRLSAKARLRALAILQGSLEGKKVQPRDSELDALVRRINAGQPWRAIFPGIATLSIEPDLDGPGIALRITRNQGEAVRLVVEDAPDAAVIGIKKVNELDFYSLGLRDLARKLGVTEAKLLHLINHLGLQNEESCFKLLRIGRTQHKRYSSVALDRLHKWIKGNDLDILWGQRGVKT